MFSKLFNRLREPSTYAGLAAAAYGLGEVFKIKEAVQVSDTLAKAAEQSAATGDLTIPLVTIAGGVFSRLMSERGSK